LTPYLTVLMPAYNEERNLRPNAARLMSALDELGVDFELLIVDDGSRDATPQIADEMAAGDARVRVVHHPRNLGIGRALYTGFRAARGEFTIFIPTDLAMRLEELSKYLNIGLVRLLYRMPVRQFQYICLYRTSFLRRVALEYADSAFIQAEVLIKARDMGLTLTEVTVNYIPRTGGAASGARLDFVVKSARDLLRFWPRWLFRHRDAQGRRNWQLTANR